MASFRWLMGILFVILCVVFLGSSYLYKPGNYLDYVSSLPILQNEESAAKVTALQHEAHEKQIKTLEKAIDTFNEGYNKLEAAVDSLKAIGDKERAIEWLVKEAAAKANTKGATAEDDKTKKSLDDGGAAPMKEALEKLHDITETLDDIASKKLPAAVNKLNSNGNNVVGSGNVVKREEEERSVAEQQALIKEIKKLLATKDSMLVDPEDPSSCSMLDKVTVDFNLPPYALASYPRSGSSWTRHLLESATGYATGAIYYDAQIQKSRLPAEGMMEGVVVIKTHETNTTLEDFRFTMRRKQNLPPYPYPTKLVHSKGAVVLVRNPFDAIESQFQLYRTGVHTITAEQIDPDAWRRHVVWAISSWYKFYEYWTVTVPSDDYPVLIVRYEDLRDYTEVQLRKVLKFLGVQIDENRLNCAVEATRCEFQSICRKGKSGESLKYYSPDLRQMVLKNLTRFMQRFGYETNIPLKWDADPVSLFVSPSVQPKPAIPCTGDLSKTPFVTKILEQKEMWKKTMQEEETLEEKLHRLRNPPIVMMWVTGSWHGWGMTGYNDYAAIDMKKPPLKCLFTRNANLFRNSTMVMIEPPGHIHRWGREWCQHEYPFPNARYNWQKWAEFDYEGENQFPILKEENFMSSFDYEISWRDGSRYHISLNCPTAANRTFLDPPPKKKKGALAAYFATRCIARKRDDYVKELMEYIPVHSYGACLHNKDMEEENAGEWPRNWHLKIETMGRYKFALTFENDNFTSWVTEKMPHAVLAGTVPIYMGADNIEYFEPGEHSLVRTDNFKSPKELAEYLKMLDENDDLYEEYYDWKKKGLSPGFQQHYDNCVYYSDIRICEDLVKQQKEELRILLNMLERSGKSQKKASSASASNKKNTAAPKNNNSNNTKNKK